MGPRRKSNRRFLPGGHASDVPEANCLQAGHLGARGSMQEARLHADRADVVLGPPVDEFVVGVDARLVRPLLYDEFRGHLGLVDVDLLEREGTAQLVPLCGLAEHADVHVIAHRDLTLVAEAVGAELVRRHLEDRKSTRLNSSHMSISYAVFCLKKKKK